MFKNLLFSSLAFFVISCQTSTSSKNIEVVEEEKIWFTKVEEAINLSKETGKPIFAFFTGKVWCHWCKKLDGEILSKDTFVNYAKENLILLELDFPRGSRNLPANQIAMARKFQIKGYPTVIIMDADKNQLGRTGYERMTPEAYVNYIKSIIE